MKPDLKVDFVPVDTPYRQLAYTTRSIFRKQDINRTPSRSFIK